MCVCRAQAVTEEQLSRAVKRLHMSSAESLNITDAGSLVAHELRLFDHGPAVALLRVDTYCSMSTPKQELYSASREPLYSACRE
jgi:hypothetical protein